MRGDLGAYFIELLVHLRDWTFDVGPVEADARSAILKTKGAMQRGQLRRQSIGDALALLRLHPFPRLTHAVPVEMGMPAFHLRDEGVRDVVKIERATLLGNDGVEQDLKQEIA